ncbi:CIC11C00000004773 [Sungouiella intermedia]|uniref:Palmitoyltransferase n=1 Tax=Sungouiella intermedia TaxID=45354 RepID=A0A1L0GE61_9ASCO|nr:CIC11C00000004773 [[Candida] intermedia]
METLNTKVSTEIDSASMVPTDASIADVPLDELERPSLDIEHQNLEDIGLDDLTKVESNSEALPNPEEIDDTNEEFNNTEAAKASEEASNPTLALFMAACQNGDLEGVKSLISSGEVSASDTFSEGITGLHWAAINNRITVVKYLMENDHSKADPNAFGGTLHATPLHWACRNGLVYVVDYFLSHTDADPTLVDSQKYNALHLAVHSSNITLVVYLLLNCVVGKRNIYIDEQDGIHCTPLHWAAYQGDILTVNALIKYGADVNKVDKSLMTPLHWSFIRGYKSVMSALLEAQSDIFAKNDKGKDSFAVSKDMNCENTWLQVLKEADRDPALNWQPRRHIISAKIAKLITFFTPYVVLPVVLYICSFAEGLTIPKLFLSGLVIAVAGLILEKLVVPTYMLKERPMFKTPLMAGVFSATAFWAVLLLIVTIIPWVWKKLFLQNVVLAIMIGIFSATFFKAMFINPGYVPEPSDPATIQEQVKDLIAIGKFDTEHFCVNTFVRKPLRSKYSKFCNRLIARFDHYCPWVYNDIGVRNHKLFMTFVYTLTIAIPLFNQLTSKYFEMKAEKLGYESDFENKCYLLSENLCVGFYNNHFLFNLYIWCWFQFMWLSFLCVVQTFQIFKGLTSWEFSSLSDKVSSPKYNHSTVPRDFHGPNAPPMSEPPMTHAHTHRHGFSTLMKLIGLDQFFLTLKLAALSIFQRTTHSQSYTSIDNLDIPTDFGWKQNWLDFWFIGDIEWRNLLFLPIEGENNLNGKVVDYYKLYEYPPKVSGPEVV